MKIYLSHSSAYNYEHKLYQPIKNSTLMNSNEILFPHESKLTNTKDYIKTCDIVIAETSLPSTGQGIELGWAESFGVPIICFYEKGATITTSLEFITNNIIEYESSTDLIEKLIKNLE